MSILSEERSERQVDMEMRYAFDVVIIVVIDKEVNLPDTVLL